GEAFDSTGLTIKLHYDNGTSDLVDSGFTVTGYDASIIGTQTLTISYGGKTTTLTVTVLAKSLESISVKTPPKTVYVEGETFSDSGMELILHYNNGDTLIVTTGWDPFNADISSVGRYTLTVSYEGKSAPLTVTVVAKTLVGISVKTPPRQTYFAGEIFDDSEMVLTLHYDNGTVSDLISGWTVLGFDSDLLGTQILTVLYAGKETSLSVTVSEVVLESISVHTPPELTYIEGLEFDDLGMILTLHYSDGSTAQISSGWSISGYDPLMTGEQVLTVSYEGKSASLIVQVLPKTLASISVKQPPKTAYFENQSFSTEGMALTLHYNNGTEETITSGWTLSGFDSSKIGQQTVTVSYGGKQTTLSVSVAGIVLQAITVEVAPNLQYLEGSSFCDDGMVLRLHYNDGTSRLVSEGWTVSGYDGSIVGRQSVTVTYDGASVLLTVTVIAKSLTEISVGIPPVSSYLEGAPFCGDGMTLILHYDNGTTQQISAGWTVVGFDAYDIGSQTLTVSYAGKSTSLTVTVIAKSLSEILLEAPPKTSYLQGIAFDDDGMVLRLVYDNGTSELVSDGWMISGFDPDHVGTQSVTVTYAGKTLALSVSVVERSLTHITVATPPQTVYVEGLPFDSSKMRLTLHYDNGTCETVSQGWTVSGFDPTLLGAQAVTVSYADRTVEIAVSVIAKSLIGISLEASPQTDYEEGSAFVDAGMVLRLDYNNGTHEFVSDGWTISGYDSSMVGNQALTVSYGDFSLLLSVSVRAKTAISASLVTLPDRTVFLRGEALDPAGLSVLVEYDNGTSALFSQGWTLVGYDASTEGACNVTATVEGVSVIFSVTVKSPVPDRITSSVYRISDGVVRRVSAGTSVMHLLDGLNEMPYLKVYRNNASLNSQASVATGDTVRLEDGDRVKDSVIAVVTGDVNGDGVVSVTDLLMVKAHLLKKTSLTGIYSIAGDVSDDGSVSVTDFLQMKAYLLGTKNSFETK
ncbi:MAG: bacterial Ig-like domain-containing protein, partial [Clostridia bacterium]|nr:bacterial Ig-like domain-containing protein [Clostridia bacterium]